MIQTIDLKKGMVFEKDGKLLKVLAINHHKPGKGNTLMQMDIQDVRSGSIVHTTMRPSEKVEQVMVNKKNTFTTKVTRPSSWTWKLTNNTKSTNPKSAKKRST